MFRETDIAAAAVWVLDLFRTVLEREEEVGTSSGLLLFYSAIPMFKVVPVLKMIFFKRFFFPLVAKTRGSSLHAS